MAQAAMAQAAMARAEMALAAKNPLAFDQSNIRHHADQMSNAPPVNAPYRRSKLFIGGC